jgi:hypothetical protein
VSAEPNQSPAASLEYEPAERIAKLRRRRRWQRSTIALALLFAAVLLLVFQTDIRRRVARWQGDRALAKAMATPAENRFPPGEVVYAVPAGSFSLTIPNPILHRASSAAVAGEAEFKALTHGSYITGPLLFLGPVTDAAGKRALLAVAFFRCVVRPERGKPDPELQSGYYVELSFSWLPGGESVRCYMGTPYTRLAPLSMLDWKYKPQDEHWAALPLTFYGGHIDPADPAIAVLPITLGDRNGQLRIRFDSAGKPTTTVIWDK